MSSKSGNDGSYIAYRHVRYRNGQEYRRGRRAEPRGGRAEPASCRRIAQRHRDAQGSRRIFSNVIALTSPDQRYDSVFLSNYALLNLYDALARVPGVGTCGSSARATTACASGSTRSAWHASGVTATDIAAVVHEQNVVAPAGSLGRRRCPQGQQMQVRGLRARVGSREVTEFENIILRASSNGQVVRLRDVARVELAAADYRIAAFKDADPARAASAFSCSRTPTRSMLPRP